MIERLATLSTVVLGESLEGVNGAQRMSEVNNERVSRKIAQKTEVSCAGAWLW